MEKNNINILLDSLDMFIADSATKEFISYMKKLCLPDTDKYSYFLIASTFREIFNRATFFEFYIVDLKETENKIRKNDIVKNTNEFYFKDYLTIYRNKKFVSKKLNEADNVFKCRVMKDKNYKRFVLLSMFNVEDMECKLDTLSDIYNKISELAHVNFEKEVNVNILYNNILDYIKEFRSFILTDILDLDNIIGDGLDFMDQDSIMSELNDIGSGHFELDDISDVDYEKDSIEVRGVEIQYNISFTVNSSHHLGSKHDGFEVSNSLHCRQTIAFDFSLHDFISEFFGDSSYNLHDFKDSYSDYMDHAVRGYTKGELIIGTPSFYG